MPRKKIPKQEKISEYCTASEAAQRLTFALGRVIRPDYLSKLVKTHKHTVHSRRVGNMLLYKVDDLDKVHITQRKRMVPECTNHPST